MGWVSVCKASYVKPDSPFSASVGDKRIGIYVIDSEYFAMDDVCPHANALLSPGFFDEGTIECLLHGAVFDVKTGKCLREPGDRDLQTYPVRLDAGQIQVNLTES
ncbi:putative Rieske protein [Yersinia frederiksenii]|uniref:Rieske [2Fe-2S] domain protein n=2 Tax=Yersinia frederiksenii TaxID=29484 RepID=A0ABR4W804_YERFR|nr:non-heme iron oxygenase ferredoxin subunit [Yersinia frederiksenii]ATM94585.1 Rieske (2Fe-2S) protein [Yersinia frederiksenii]KGA48838.1 rieske [2Fe-2S] domain protein [Yersinia frederiksenii ATCC 33641]CFR06822.1 putative Rieske protein [Yersinia frederiksenii]CNC59352.1 putative Rieske protein [Yersinia frederiksenii]CNF77954.1 putative Rieske protein [Yersinia frederiksenii]